MNDYDFLRGKPRNQTLLLVEGEKTEKAILNIISKSTPYNVIEMKNVHVFRSNIYNLFSLIESEYPGVWDDENVDINIPLLISRRENLDIALDKRDFTNIILAFDFDKQDSQYSAKKICIMQKRFSDMTGEGILYLSYPMIEAFYDMKEIPEEWYYKRIYSATYRRGKEYKRYVLNYSCLIRYFDFYDILVHKFDGRNHEVEYILNNNFCSFDELQIMENEEGSTSEKFIYELNALLRNFDMDFSKKTFYEQVWSKIYIVSLQNITKAWWIQTGTLVNDKESVHDIYNNIDLLKILEKQINVSADVEKGIIYVLCTPIMLLGEYKFFWNM